MSSAHQSRRRVALDGRTLDSHSPKFRFRSFLARRRKVLAISGVAPVIIVAAIAAGMATASACHPLIEAGADCNGVVSFTATAWNDADATDETRTNTNVAVQYSINGVDGPFETVKSSGPKYEFTKQNGFSFSDTFVLPANLKRPTDVTVQAVAVAKWGTNADLDVANQTQKTTIRVPAECTVPTAKISGPTCASRVAHVVFHNDSTEPVEFSLFRDGSVAPFVKQSVTKGSVTREITVDKSFVLAVKAPNMKTVEQSLSIPTDCVQVASTVTKVCKADASGWTVSYDNSKNEDERTFVLKSGDRTIDTVKVEAGKKQTASYSFADVGVAAGVVLPVSVVVDGAAVVTETIINDCVNVSANVEAVCDTPAGSGAVLSFANTGQVADTFTVVRDGKAVDGSPFTLQPSDQTTQKLLKMNNGDSSVIAIMSTSGLNVQKQVVLTCGTPAAMQKPAEVKGETIVRAQLADTGTSVVPIAFFGALLLLTGVGILGIRRRVFL